MSNVEKEMISLISATFGKAGKEFKMFILIDEKRKKTYNSKRKMLEDVEGFMTN